MSTILATELFQARCDAAIATSKLLLENSHYNLRNAPINAKLLFGNKIKEVAKSNYEAQQQRFLASSSSNTNQQQKASYSATKAFKIPKLPNKSSRSKQSQTYRSKNQAQSFMLAGLGGSVGCAVRLETRRSPVQPPPRLATFFRGD